MFFPSGLPFFQHLREIQEMRLKEIQEMGYI